MLVFHGGLSIEQVQLLQQNKYVIFKMIPRDKIFIPHKNTFDYYDCNRNYESKNDYWNYIRDDIYYNQYLFFFKYLKNALNFCHNSSKRNYILVADLDENILNDYIGCGRYIDNQVEYRVPRRFLTLDTIKDFLFYEPYDVQQTLNFSNRYPINFYSSTENEEANQIMKQKQLKFNKYKNHPKFN